MIELGQIRAGLVVGTESSRPLVETTIQQLNEDSSLTRQAIKLAVASLTIGSGSCAILLTNRELSRTENRVLGGVTRANTDYHRLCHSGHDEAGGDSMRPLMQTDSEKLMAEGIATGALTFETFLEEMSWDRSTINKSFCHQVGTAHRRLLFETIRLDPAHDFATVEFLGNTGSVALPLSMALGIENGWLDRNDQIVLLGIGSGINCLMLGMDWQQATVGNLSHSAQLATTRSS